MLEATEGRGVEHTRAGDTNGEGEATDSQKVETAVTAEWLEDHGLERDGRADRETEDRTRAPERGADEARPILDMVADSRVRCEGIRAWTPNETPGAFELQMRADKSEGER
jgi:hypothetical protein